MTDFAYLHNTSIRHTDVIVQIVKLMGCNKYLELGIWNGSNITKVSEVCGYCVGVDIKDERQYYNYVFKLNTTNNFFSENNETFDIIFIDADHNFESVKKDFESSIKILNKFGIILIHDTDPINEEYYQPCFCGDSYKITEWIEKNYLNLNVLTLPITEAGLTIVNRKTDRRVFNNKQI